MFIILLLVVSASAQTEPEATAKYNGYPFTFYNKGSSDRLTYDDASQVCKDGGGSLAMIKDDEIQSFITTQLRGLTLVEEGWSSWYRGYWVGGLCNGGRDNWEWEDGTTIGVPGFATGYENWYSGVGCTVQEPNYNTPSTRAYVYPLDTESGCTNIFGTWGDDTMDRKMNWICMREFPTATHNGYLFTFFTYNKESSDQLSYDNASQVCTDGGGSLAMIKDVGTQNFITEQFRTLGLVEDFASTGWSGYWVGGVCSGGRNNWQWEDGIGIGVPGSTTDYENWYNNNTCGAYEPNNNAESSRAYVYAFEKASNGGNTCPNTLGTWGDTGKDARSNWICMKELWFNGFWWKFYNPSDPSGRLSYEDAKSKCEADGDQIAQIKDEATQQFITVQLGVLDFDENNWGSTSPFQRGYWVGGVCVGCTGVSSDQGKWQWEDGTNVGAPRDTPYENWYNWYDTGCNANEPNNNQATSRLVVLAFDTLGSCINVLGRWADTSDGNDAKPWICMEDLQSSNPCKNGGSFSPVKDKCICAPGYIGQRCKIDIDDCVSNPCMNGGTCTDGVNQFTCNCTDGFTGDTCETNIDECASNPCMNGGTCTDGVNQFTCNCVDGVTGDRCQNDLCSNNPCENNGTCIFMTSQYYCQCLDGYSGRNCSIDPCSNVVCGGDCEVVGSNGVCSEPFNGTDGLVIGLACALAIAFLLLLAFGMYFVLQKRNVDKNATVHHNQAFKVEEEYEKYEVAYEEIGDDYSLEKNKMLPLYVGLTANYNAELMRQFGDMAQKIDFNAKPTFKKMVKLSCSVGSDKGYQLLISPSPRVDNLPTFWKEVCERRVRIIVGFPASDIQLYPSVENPENFGSMKILTKETKNFSFYSMSKVEIVEQLTDFKNVSMETIVFQFNPNYDIITSNNLFVWLTNKVSEIPITDDSSMVVFGSDIPSGLFAAYNLLIRSNGNKIDIYNQVLNLRRINPKFFQNLESYALLHELLVEYFELGNTELGLSQIKSEISTRNEFDLLQKTVYPFKRETSFNLQGSIRNTKVFATCVDNPEKFWTKILEKEPGLVVSCDKHKTLTKIGLNNRRRQTFGKMHLNLRNDFVEVESLGVKHKVEIMFLDGSNWVNTSKKFQQLCDQFMRVVVIINENEVTMLALSQLLNRFETESKFDVYRQVKELDLEVTMEQYDTIYKCLLHHIQEENTYVNAI